MRGAVAGVNVEGYSTQLLHEANRSNAGPRCSARGLYCGQPGGGEFDAVECSMPARLTFSVDLAQQVLARGVFESSGSG